MNKRIVNLCKGLLLFSFTLVFIFILFFIIVYFFLNIFVNFRKLSSSVALWITLGISSFLTIILFCYILRCFQSKKMTKMRHWLSQNYPTLLLFYVVLTISFGSIKSEIIWSFASLKEIVELQWTIFGISITIFLVWNVVILKFLEKSKPIKSDKICSVYVWDYINKKEDFYPRASAFFNTVKLLILNVCLLVVATGSVFIVKEEVTLFSQNIVTVSFYFTINTLVELFLDILIPLREEKKAILKETRVTADDIKEKNEIEEKIQNASRLIRDIEQLESVNVEQKSKMKAEIAFKALGIEQYFESDATNTDTEEQS